MRHAIGALCLLLVVSAARPAAATPPFGSETVSLLRRLGFSDEAIRGLVDQGLTRTGWPA